MLYLKQNKSFSILFDLIFYVIYLYSCFKKMILYVYFYD